MELHFVHLGHGEFKKMLYSFPIPECKKEQRIIDHILVKTILIWTYWWKTYYTKWSAYVYVYSMTLSLYTAGNWPWCCVCVQVSEGDELTCYYHYLLSDCPDWYAELWEAQGSVWWDCQIKRQLVIGTRQLRSLKVGVTAASVGGIRKYPAFVYHFSHYNNMPHKSLTGVQHFWIKIGMKKKQTGLNKSWYPIES